jgi:hypothetical protein
MGAKGTPTNDDVVIGGSLMHERKPDFSGWATKANLKCSDGRTILPDAFKHQDKLTVPLVWQHNHDEPENVLGHALLENRDEGVYCYGFFNETDKGEHAKTLVKHEDIKSLSIFANGLVEKAKAVMHGMIREVSLVMAGANPGAMIDNLMLQHSDGNMVTLEDEAVIYTGLELAHEDKPADTKDKPAEDDGPSVQDVYEGMTEDQKNVVHYMVGAALEGAKKDTPTPEAEHSGSKPDSPNDEKKEGTRTMSRNVFEEQNKDKDGEGAKHTLTHDAMKGIFAEAQRSGSFKEAIQDYALKHGIDNIEILFPDARAVEATPDFDKRRTEWVASVINGTKKSPFTRIKNFWADITLPEARAKGYIKGEMKKEEWFGVSKRTTGPATVYKKQSLDRDDVLDITDFDVILWMKGEMRLMIEEELARAILVGDGREIDDPDKVKDPAGANAGDGIRSILNDHDLYAASVFVASTATPQDMVDEILRSMRLYKGSGNPTLFTTLSRLTEMLLARDDIGRRLYRTASELASELQVSSIVPVEVLDEYPELVGIIVNLKDYTIGTDRGGELTSFEDFDIDYNKHKYLIETRLSGALTKIRSALVIKLAGAGETLVEPTAPTFDGTTIAVPAQTGVSYRRADTNAVVTNTNVAVPEGESLKIYAQPTAGNYFSNNVDDEWTFTNAA